MAPAAQAIAVLLAAAAACPAAAMASAVGTSCPGPAGPVAVGTAQWNGWGREIGNSRYQPEPAIRASDVPKLRLKWAHAYAVGGTGSIAAPTADAAATVDAQPTVVDGRLFAASASGRVYSLDAVTGCTYWTFDAAAGTRTAIVVGELGALKRTFGPKKSKVKKKDAHIDVEKPPSAVFFGDDGGAVYALDAQSGRLLWKTQADGHPLARIAGSPTLYRDRLYVPVASSEARAAESPQYACCTFRGSVVALDIGTGRTLWKTYMTGEEPRPYKLNAAGVQLFEPAGAAVATSPAIDTESETLYVATGRAYGDAPQAAAGAIVALNLADGKIAWAKQLPETNTGADFDGAPVLRKLSVTRKIVVAAQKSADVYGLDPNRAGDFLWRSKLQIAGAGGIQWGPAADYRSVYVAFAAPQDASATSAGGLVALDVATGHLRWAATAPQPPCSPQAADCSHRQSQAVTVIPGTAFLGSIDGHLRAYSTIDGKVLWDFDTARSYSGADGVAVNGGALDRGGAVVVGGMVYVNSGDVLLAFSVDGK